MRHLLTTLLFILFLTSNFAAQDETRVLTVWRVAKYDIDAKLPSTAADRNLNVRAILNVQNISNANASRLSLRINSNAEVSGVTVNNSAANFTKSEEKLGATGVLQRIVVSMPAVAPNAAATVAVNYVLKVPENSGLSAIAPNGAQFLPTSFWYPTPNSHYSSKGADFAPFRLNIAVNAGEAVISSGRNSGSAYEQTLNGQPFFFTGAWDETEASGIKFYLPKGAGENEKARSQEIAALVVAAKTFIGGLIGDSAETPLRVVAVRRGVGFSDAGTFFLDYGTFRRRKIDAQTALNLAESIAKIRLGNSAIVRGDGYGAVRDGLARFIATQFIEKQFGRDVAETERLRQRASYAAVSQRDAPLNFAAPIDDYYFTAVANKGAMIWRLLAKSVGEQQFFSLLRSQLQSGSITLADLRAAFSAQQAYLDYAFTQPTEMNLLVGLPQTSGAQTKVAIRNLGVIDADVAITGTTDKGEKLTVPVMVKSKSLGEAVFNTPAKIVRAEIDQEKFYPQIDYSDDVAPREFKESDQLLAIKRAFDRQDFAEAEKSARVVLQSYPRFDEARIVLARSLAAQNKTADAEKEFRAVLDEKLPTARSLAWANVGLGEIAAKANQTTAALDYFSQAIIADAEYGATYAARAGRAKIQTAPTIDDSVRAYFSQFDKAAVSGRRTDLDNLVAPGEITKFVSGIGGQAQLWETRLIQVDKIDDNTVLAQVDLRIRLLNRNEESGTAIYQLTRSGNVWKMSGVEIFEVR